MTKVTYDKNIDRELLHDHVSADITDLTTTLDPRYVNVAGDTMTGALTITPSANGASILNVTDQVGASVLNVDTTSGFVGFNNSTPSATLDFIAKAISGRESILLARVSDAPEKSLFSIGNGTTSGATFAPTFIGGQEVSTQRALTFRGGVNTNADTGTIPVIQFNSYTYANSTDAIVGTQLSVSTRPLFAFSNSTTIVMQLNADGNVGIGTTAPEGRLHINGTANDEQLIIEGHSIQTVNLAEWRDSSSGVLISFDGVGGAIFNEQGSATADFRVESDTEANMLFLDANADTDGALYLGGTTNGIKINKGGTLTFLGTASISGGASGSFTTADGKTVTVTNGIITNIV